jgi:hypothetical protein
MLSIALFGLRACRFRVYFCRLSFAPPFLSYKMIARNLLGSTGRRGASRRAFRIRVASGLFCSHRVHACPSVSAGHNANRCVA